MRRLATRAALLALASAAALTACQPGGGTGGGTGGGGGSTTDPCAPPSDQTRHVFEALRAPCQGCHNQGARGYFASIDAFESLLVRDPRLVSPGHPDDSELVRLLEARSTGAFRQMPIGQQTYADLLASGAATLSIADVRSWVQGLTAAPRDTRPSPDAPHVTRLSAAQIQRALYQQLGIGYDDFYRTGQNYDIPAAVANGDTLYPMQAPEALPGPFETVPAERYHALGGGSVLRQVRPDPSTSPTFVQTLTQVAQRWCRIALTKTPNSALFPDGGGPAGTEPEVRATIARWFTHFLGERPGDAAVDEVYRTVYTPIAHGADPLTGYVGVCSYFIRHPDWIFY